MSRPPLPAEHEQPDPSQEPVPQPLASLKTSCVVTQLEYAHRWSQQMIASPGGSFNGCGVDLSQRSGDFYISRA